MRRVFSAFISLFCAVMTDTQRNNFLYLVAVVSLCFPPAFAEQSTPGHPQVIFEQSSLDSDSRKSNATWNEFFWSRPGTLKLQLLMGFTLGIPKDS
jgi:hypothetical protein